MRVQIPAKAKFAPTCVRNSLLSYYLFIIVKLFKVKDGYLKFVYVGKKHLLIYDVHMYQCIDIHWRFFL